MGTDCLVASDVDSLVLPIDACGGIGALAFANSDKQKVTYSCSTDHVYIFEVIFLRIVAGLATFSFINFLNLKS